MAETCETCNHWCMEMRSTSAGQMAHSVCGIDGQLVGLFDECHFHPSRWEPENRGGVG